jgi:uncharacterized coiled-coil protein SlyX
MSYANSVRVKNPVDKTEDEEKLGCIQQQIGAVENSSLESTRRALLLINESREVGTKTAEELASQGEKLNKIEEHMDKLNVDLTETQKNLNRMKSVFGGIINKFTFGKKKDASSSNKNSKVADQTSPRSSVSSTNGEVCSEARTGFAVITGSDREQELNSNLEELSLGLKGLADLARGMQREIDRQDPILGRLNDKSEATKSRIDDQNAQMKKLLK